MSAQPQLKLSFEPVLVYLHDRSPLSVAKRLGKDNKQVHRWINDGVTHGCADEIAVALDVHPTELWGAEWGGVPLTMPTGRPKVTLSAVPVPPVKPQLGLVSEEPPEDQPKTLVEQVLALIEDGLEPGHWFRVAIMPTSRSAKALTTRLGKHETTARMVLEWRAAGLKVFVRGPS